MYPGQTLQEQVRVTVFESESCKWRAVEEEKEKKENNYHSVQNLQYVCVCFERRGRSLGVVKMS